MWPLSGPVDHNVPLLSLKFAWAELRAHVHVAWLAGGAAQSEGGSGLCSSEHGQAWACLNSSVKRQNARKDSNQLHTCRQSRRPSLAKRESESVTMPECYLT